MFKMGCSMARKILGPGAGSSSNGQAEGEFNNSNNEKKTTAGENCVGVGGGGKPKSGDELGDFSKLEEDPRLPLNHLKGRELNDSMELREHAATVMSTLDQSINSLSDYDNFISYLHSIGALHRKVPGFKRDFFWKIEQPFMMAVKQTLDERCNETIEQIYKIAIKLIIETIADGYGQDSGAADVAGGGGSVGGVGGQSGASGGGGTGTNQAKRQDKGTNENSNEPSPSASGGGVGGKQKSVTSATNNNNNLKATIDALASATKEILSGRDRTSTSPPISGHEWRQLVEGVSGLLEASETNDSSPSSSSWADYSRAHASAGSPGGTQELYAAHAQHEKVQNNGRITRDEFVCANEANKLTRVDGAQTKGLNGVGHCLNRNDISQRHEHRQRARRHWLKSSSSSSALPTDDDKVCSNFNELPTSGNCDSVAHSATQCQLVATFQHYDHDDDDDEITSKRRLQHQHETNLATHNDNSTNDSNTTTTTRQNDAQHQNVLRFLHETPSGRYANNQQQEADLIRLLILINELASRRRRDRWHSNGKQMLVAY